MRALIFALTMLLAAPALADTNKTANILPWCAKQSTEGDYLYCLGFVSGYYIGTNQFSRQAFGEGFACPRDITVGAIVSSVVDWVKQNPAHYNVDFGTTLFVSLSEMYPCNDR